MPQQIISCLEPGLFQPNDEHLYRMIPYPDIRYYAVRPEKLIEPGNTEFGNQKAVYEEKKPDIHHISSEKKIAVLLR